MKKGRLFLSALFFFSVLNLYAQNYQINSPGDDAEESAGYTTVTLNSPVIDLTADPTNPRNMKQIVGLRFTNVQLQKGEALSNCYLAFHVDQACNKTSMLAITGEKSANAQPFQAVNRNLSSRARTTSKINWNNVEAWNETGAIMKSPDISTVLMEIIKQENWRPGNSIVLLIEGNGQRHATAYDKNPELAIQMILNDASGTRYKKPVMAQTKQQVTLPSQQQQTQKQEPIKTDECTIPEPPVGVAKQAYLQGNAYMENNDFKSAESRYSMAIDNLKHPKFYICRAAARQLLDKFDDAQSDLNQAVSMGIAPQMAQKCLSDLVTQHKNFGGKIGDMFPFCFTENIRGFAIPPCPMNISIDGETATWIAETRYEDIKDKAGNYAGNDYAAIKIIYDWKITPGNFHPCNPNIATKFKVSDNYKPTKKDEVYTANTAGWFEIPVKLDYIEVLLDKQGNEIKSYPRNEDWIFVGWLTKLHTGETTFAGRIVGVNGKGSSGLKVN